MSQAHEAESAAGREEQSQDLPADSTIVLPRSIRSTRRPKSSATFFDRNYMADEKEVKKAIQFESTDYHVAFQRWTLWLAFSLGFSDALVMAISTFLVSWGHGFRFWFIDHKGTSWLVPPWQLVAVFTLVWIASMWIVGGYHRHLMGEGYDLYAKIVSAAFAALLIAGLVCLITRIQLPRWQVFWPIAIATFLTCAERWAWRRFIHRMRLKNRMRYPVTLVGTWNGIIKAVNDIASNAGLGYRVIAVAPIIINNDGTVDADPAAKSNTRHNLWARSHDFRVLVFDSHMAATAREMGSQVVLLTDGIGRGSRDFAAFSLAVQASGMELSIPVTSTGDVNGEFNFYLHNTADTMPVLTSSLPQFRWFRQLTKRLFDFVLSVVALVLAAIPMVIIAIAIKHDDGGPVFYTQKRVGQYGKLFTMYKFRSMKVGSDKLEQQLAKQMGQDGHSTFKAKHDPRVTKVGRFLRKTSLDELPQLFNIFAGTMSFVGPRPQLPYQRDNNNAVYATRLLVKPGLTGPWQVSGRADLSDAQGEQLDVWYVSNNTFTGDIAILLKTIPAVLNGRGAY